MKTSTNRMDTLLACLIACERCVSDCVESDNKQCILLCRDCADICSLVARFEARGSQCSAGLNALCSEICRACSIECSKHAAHHDSCKECAEACIKCADICEENANAKV